MLIEVLGLQGDVSEHIDMMKRLLDEKEVKIVKNAPEIRDLDGLIIPGGESTTIGKLMQNGIDREIKKKNLAIFGTCAGVITLAKEIIDGTQPSLKLMDIKVERNAYGRQRESFETDIKIPALGEKPFRAVFIRAPVIKEVGKGVEVLARFEGDIVLAKQGHLLVSVFHPELTDDFRLHEYFLGLIK
jgi:5'-phosphate synthase pdxT subunit